MKEDVPNGPKWWDKLSCRDAELFSALEIACRLEDTDGGQFLARLQLHYEDTDPLFAVANDLWAILSHRFAAATTGRVEIICEGAFENSVLRSIELDALLSNDEITAINGLAREHFPSSASGAFGLLRRWDVERARRYSKFIASDANATPDERTSAHDDSREIQLWYEQDFFDDLGPDRELPTLPDAVMSAVDQSMVGGTWKYSTQWREFIQRETEHQEDETQSSRSDG